jgi:UDP-3-O-[3-hydroxymyristoyl] glucosamine N-acyltransferase
VTASPVASGTGGGEGARSLTAARITALVGGELEGEGDAAVAGVAPLDRATAQDVSFLANARYAPVMARSSAGVVLVAPELRASPGAARARVVVARPHEAMLTLLPLLYAQPAREPGVHPTAVIGAGARLGEGVTVGPHAVIGAGAELGPRAWIGAGCSVGDGVAVGADSRLHDGATLYPGAVVGARVVLHSGVRVASDGFGYVFRGGAHEKVPHVGRAVIEDDVEIGANSTVDRGSIDDTVIGAGTKIDNLVHVGHNVRLGRLCLIMAQVGIAGSAHLGDGVVVAGQAGLGGHIHIGDGARIAGQAGVFGNVPAGETWSGYPARPHRESLRTQAALVKIAGMLRSLERLVEARGER